MRQHTALLSRAYSGHREDEQVMSGGPMRRPITGPERTVARPVPIEGEDGAISEDSPEHSTG